MRQVFVPVAGVLAGTLSVSVVAASEGPAPTQLSYPRLAGGASVRAGAAFGAVSPWSTERTFAIDPFVLQGSFGAQLAPETFVGTFGELGWSIPASNVGSCAAADSACTGVLFAGGVVARHALGQGAWLGTMILVEGRMEELTLNATYGSDTTFFGDGSSTHSVSVEGDKYHRALLGPALAWELGTELWPRTGGSLYLRYTMTLPVWDFGAGQERGDRGFVHGLSIGLAGTRIL